MVTARDLALIALHTVSDFPQFYKYYAQREFVFNGKTQANRNLELKSVAGVDGLKTGHTEEGGFGQTTSAIRDGRRLILVGEWAEVDGRPRPGNRPPDRVGLPRIEQHDDLPRRRRGERGTGVARYAGQRAGSPFPSP